MAVGERDDPALRFAPSRGARSKHRRCEPAFTNASKHAKSRRADLARILVGFGWGQGESTMRKWVSLVFIGALGVVGNACTIQADEADRFREPIPQSSDAAMGVPGTAGATTKSQSLRLMDTPLGGASYAKYYQVTRDLADSIDGGTAWVLALVWIIVHSPPTRVEAHQAVWGPGNGDALSPVVWRFTVNESGDREYDYRLEGRPKASTSEADYKAVLAGHGWGKTRAEHRQGNFTLDFDASHALDPARSKDTGSVKIAFDLHQFPATISADLVSTDKSRYGNVTVTHQADASGAVDITMHDDVDASKTTKLEDMILHSRWDLTGAGRGDAQIQGGDLPATTPVVQASECWNSAFARVYYKDSIDAEPQAGNASACVFPQAKF
jgi:hypothetical protein